MCQSHQGKISTSNDTFQEKTLLVTCSFCNMHVSGKDNALICDKDFHLVRMY